jgi:hypothetical protein
MPKYILYGEGQDKNLFYECPKCGSINRVDRNKVAKLMYTSTGESKIEPLPYDTSDINISGIDDIVCPKLGLDSTANNKTRTVFYSKVLLGCWLCGNVNI